MGWCDRRKQSETQGKKEREWWEHDWGFKVNDDFCVNPVGSPAQLSPKANTGEEMTAEYSRESEKWWVSGRYVWNSFVWRVTEWYKTRRQNKRKQLSLASHWPALCHFSTQSSAHAHFCSPTYSTQTEQLLDLGQKKAFLVTQKAVTNIIFLTKANGSRLCAKSVIALLYPVHSSKDFINRKYMVTQC